MHESASRPKRPRASSPPWSIPSPPPSSPEHELDPRSFSLPPLHQSGSPPLTGESPAQEPTEGSSLSTTEWLQRMCLTRYAANFAAHSTVVALARALYPRQKHSTNPSTHVEILLKERYAVSTLGARKKIASALQQWAPCQTTELRVASASGKQESYPISVKTRGSSNSTTEAMEDSAIQPKKRPLWPIFTPGYVAPGDRIERKRAKADGAVLTAPKSGQRVFRVPKSKIIEPSGSKKPVKAKTANGRGRNDGGMGGGSKQHWMCHRVPGTSFTVDSFKVKKEADNCKEHFLSHMHADHYGGLTKSSLQNGAKVLCSAVTGALARVIIGIPVDVLRELPLCEPVDVPCSDSNGRGATVWLYDANHCPGAVVLLFRIWTTGEYVLHCGDCRFDRAIFEQHSELRRVVEAKELGTLYLDTTYAAPEHTFPTQKTVLDEVARAAEYENTRTRGRCIFFVGAYTIGKEKVFMAIAEAVDANIFAESRKRRILRAIGFGSRLESRIVDSANEARVHVVPMGKLGADGLREYAQKNRLDTGFIGRGLAVVVKPTGWTFKSGERTCLQRRSRAADQAVTYDVPYSEHSSFNELRDFVAWAKPRRIVPTVGFSTLEKAKELAKMLDHETALKP